MRVFITHFPDSAITLDARKVKKFNIKVAATQNSESNILVGFLTTKYQAKYITHSLQYIAEILSLILVGFMISKIIQLSRFLQFYVQILNYF